MIICTTSGSIHHIRESSFEYDSIHYIKESSSKYGSIHYIRESPFEYEGVDESHPGWGPHL